MIDEVNEKVPDELKELALSMMRANKARLERLRFKRTADMTDAVAAAALARLTAVEEEAAVAVRKVIDAAPLSDNGKSETWNLFLTNRP